MIEDVAYNENFTLDIDCDLNAKIFNIDIVASEQTQFASLNALDFPCLMISITPKILSEPVSLSNVYEIFNAAVTNTFDYGVAHFLPDHHLIMFFPLNTTAGEALRRVRRTQFHLNKYNKYYIEMYNFCFFLETAAQYFTAGNMDVTIDMSVGVK